MGWAGASAGVIMGADETKLLAEWFWTDRWMGSRGFLLPMEARGLYREMLTQCWRRGGALPKHPEAIRRATGCTIEEWERCWPLVEPFWVTSPDGETIYNPTQQEVIADTLARKEAKTNRARKAANARWGKHKQCTSNANAVLTQCPPSPSPSLASTKQEPPKPPKGGRVDSADIDAVLAHYREWHPKSRPGDKQRKLVAARLKEGWTVADLQAAIDGNHRSPFHCGRNDTGAKHHTLRVIFRDSDQVQRFMDEPKQPAPSAKVQRTNEAAQRWIDAKRRQDEQQKGIAQ